MEEIGAPFGRGYAATIKACAEELAENGCEQYPLKTLKLPMEAPPAGISVAAGLDHLNCQPSLLRENRSPPGLITWFSLSEALCTPPVRL
jgi:hypothetical protein